MPSFLSISTVLLVLISCVFLKLSAFLFRRTVVSWKLALACAALSTGCVLIFEMLLLPWVAKYMLSLIYILANFELPIQLGVSAGLLGAKAKTATGETLGFKGGLILSLISYAIASVTAGLLTVVLLALPPAIREPIAGVVLGISH